ncbi:MAG TPA: V-type ATP synthase subunit I [Sedimentisphaerales bacterium]|nr:V-type ATP synthase subunit I [Sedimentisphaerales bacterium]
MGIAQMAKVMIVTHRSQASDLLEVLQREGICQILNAEEAVIIRDFPDLAASGERPRDIEQLLSRLTKTIVFLKVYDGPQKGLAGVLAPRTVVDEQSYENVVSDRRVLTVIDHCEQTEAEIDTLRAECDSLNAALEMLYPWASLETPVEEIGRLRQTACLAGLIPGQQFEKTLEQIADLGAAIQQIAQTNNKYACLIVCLKQNISDLQKLLRSVEFEPVSFENMTGTAAELIEQHREKLNEARNKLQQHYDQAASLSENLLKLEILNDHYTNLLNREQTRTTAPATEQTVILEGWVKKKDYPRLEKIVSAFGASTLQRVEPAPDEETPVEIDNKKLVKPFEVITRLYGMPKYFNVDPTVFLAPFFALFFALCLTDAGYGLVIVALMVFFIKKFQGDKKLMWMLGICAAVTIVAGALTGGWFGDAVQKLNIPSLTAARHKLMWFDPLEKPMTFFYLALALGYIQLMTGLVIAFAHNVKQKDYAAAVCDQLTWLLMLNSIVLFLAGKSAGTPISAQVGRFFGYLALVPAAAILLFSQREGPLAGRLGMGAYNLFSTIFYMGDVLSYLRLMALGMVTAGLAMAINVIAEIASKAPYGIGIVLMIVILIGGHAFNMAINTLGAFVHTLRLQYVEFFPKFLIGGGRAFEPLTKQYNHIYIKK